MFNDKKIIEKLNLYKNGFKILKKALDNHENSFLFIPDENHWSIHEIVVHLADTEGIYFVRFRVVISENSSQLLMFDQEKWAKNMNYRSQLIENSLESLEYTRKSNYNLLLKIENEDWQNFSFKIENQDFSLEKLLDRNLNHFYGHVETIKKRIDEFNNY